MKEVFLTLQGEGAHAGRAAVFCRFAGCNLWSGREADRAAAQCRFCDTDFVGIDGTRGGSYAVALAALVDVIERNGAKAAAIASSCSPAASRCCRSMSALIDALHARGFTIAVETNGTIEPPAGLDWICVSPKAGTELRVRRGHELKLVYPQAGAPPEAFAGSRLRALLAAADGRAGTSPTTPRARSTIACDIRNGG